MPIVKRIEIINPKPHLDISHVLLFNNERQTVSNKEALVRSCNVIK